MKDDLQGCEPEQETVSSQEWELWNMDHFSSEYLEAKDIPLIQIYLSKSFRQRQKEGVQSNQTWRCMG